MAGVVDGLADFRDPTCNSSGSLVVYDHDGPNCLLPVLEKSRFYLRWIYAVTPIAGYELHIQTPTQRHGVPQSRKLPGLERQHFVARRESIDDARFPGPGARTGKNHHGVGGLKDRVTAVQNFLSKPAKIGTAVIDDCPIHRAQNAIRHIGRTGNLQEVTPRTVAHE